MNTAQFKQLSGDRILVQSKKHLAWVLSSGWARWLCISPRGSMTIWQYPISLPWCSPATWFEYIFSVLQFSCRDIKSTGCRIFFLKKIFSFGLRKSFFALLSALPLIVERAFVCLRLVMWKAIRMAVRSSADMFLKATAHNKKSVVGSLFLLYRLQDFLWMIRGKTTSHTSCLCMLLRWFHLLLIPSPGAIRWVLGNRTKQHERRWLYPWIPKWIKQCLVKERQCLS